MKKYSLLIIFIALVVNACASVFPEKELDSDNLSIEKPFEYKELNKVIIFNDSSWLLYGYENEAGYIQIKIDGKEIGTLKTGKYLVAALKKGKHTVELLHKDTISFATTHDLEVGSDIQFFQIAAEMTSHKAMLVPRPKNFEKRYKICCEKAVFLKEN
jgi:hypothetical protein